MNNKAPKMRAIYTSKRFEIKKVYTQNLDHSSDASMPIESGFEILDYEGALQVTYCTDIDADALTQALKTLRKLRASKSEIDNYLELAVTSDVYELSEEVASDGDEYY
jgi:hypothetical protein